MDQHLEPVDDASAALACEARQLRLGRPVGEVHHDVSFGQRIGIQRQRLEPRTSRPDAWAMPTRRRVDDRGRSSSICGRFARRRAARSRRARPPAPRRARESGSRSRPRRPRRRSAQTHARAEPPAPSTSARVPGAASAAERVEQPGGVGVVGRDPPRRRSSACWRRRSRARPREASSASASAASLCGTVTLAPAKPSPGIARPAPERLGLDVDRLVASTRRQAQLGQRGVLHRRRARVGDRVAEDGERRRHPTAASATCRRPRRGRCCSAACGAANSASVVANASSPQVPGLVT